MADFFNLNVYLAVCAISFAVNPTYSFHEWRCTPGVEIDDDTVQLEVECSENEVTASWQSDGGASLINIEYQCYPVGKTPTGLTTILEQLSERTTHSKSFAVPSLEDTTMECTVLGCYFEDFSFRERSIAPASCVLGSTDEPSPSATISPSSLPSSSASPSPARPSNCNCDCSRNVVIEYSTVPTGNDVSQGTTIGKRDINETTQEAEDKGYTIEAVTLCVVLVLGLLIIGLLMANILLMLKMKESRKCTSCHNQGRFN